ncbi:MAG: hypothetical protein ACREH8_23295 [Opitutaceae bacterium]
MKKLSTLLSRRPALLRQARLANLAFAYATLQNVQFCINRAQLSGRVTLRPAAPHAERYLPALIALEGNQSVIEEHFTEEDLMELADVLAFVTGNDALDTTFALEDLGDLFLLPLRLDLEREGIVIDRPAAQVEERRQG